MGIWAVSTFCLLLLWTYVDSPEFSEPVKWEKLNSTHFGKQFPSQESVSFSQSGSLSIHPFWPEPPPGQGEPDSCLDALKVLPRQGDLRPNPVAGLRLVTLLVLEADVSPWIHKESSRKRLCLLSLPLVHSQSGFLSPFLQMLIESLLCAMNWGFQQWTE